MDNISEKMYNTLRFQAYQDVLSRDLDTLFLPEWKMSGVNGVKLDALIGAGYKNLYQIFVMCLYRTTSRPACSLLIPYHMEMEEEECLALEAQDGAEVDGIEPPPWPTHIFPELPSIFGRISRGAFVAMVERHADARLAILMREKLNVALSSLAA